MPSWRGDLQSGCHLMCRKAVAKRIIPYDAMRGTDYGFLLSYLRATVASANGRYAMEAHLLHRNCLKWRTV